MARNPRRIGVFGGTFDPIHAGHLVAATWVRDVLDLDVVQFVVANEPWQKVGSRPISPAADRLAMVEAAVASIDGLEASAIEIERGGLTYTLDTLEAMAEHEPGCRLFLVLGSDTAAGFDTWHRSDDIAARAELVVVDRPGAVGARPPVRHRVVECPLVDLSSTQIRAWAEAGRPLDGLVPPAALAVCRARNLYGSDG